MGPVATVDELATVGAKGAQFQMSFYNQGDCLLKGQADNASSQGTRKSIYKNVKKAQWKDEVSDLNQSLGNYMQKIDLNSQSIDYGQNAHANSFHKTQQKVYNEDVILNDREQL